MKRRAVSLVLCGCFAAAALFAENAAVSRVDHDCHGEGCPVCLLIQEAECFFRQIKSAVFRPGFFPGVFLTALFVLCFAFFYGAPMSAVRLKVKMNR